MFDDYEGFGGNVSFAALEKVEAERFSKMLQNLDDKMYSEVLPSTESQPNDNSKTRNYYSEGYDANYETIGTDEIKQWQQSSFSFLRATGENIWNGIGKDKELQYDHEEQQELNNDHYFESLDDILPGKQLNMENLQITGHAVIFHPTIGTGGNDFKSTNEEDEVEEVFASHGILEDYITYNGEDSLHEICEVNELVSPSSSMREEVIESMLDAIWPELVSSMKPLIREVLLAAKEHNIPYNVEQVSKEEEDGGGFDFASDDGGW